MLAILLISRQSQSAAQLSGPPGSCTALGSLAERDGYVSGGMKNSEISIPGHGKLKTHRRTLEDNASLSQEKQATDPSRAGTCQNHRCDCP